MNKEEKRMADWFFGLVGYFNHYSFFTKKLWKKVKGFKDHDEAEIKCVFMHYWFHNKFGCFTFPCGLSWFAECDEETFNKYIEKYKPIFDAFIEWCREQR